MKSKEQTTEEVEYTEYIMSLLRNEEEVVELRIQSGKRGNEGGYFNDYEAMGNEVAKYNGTNNIWTTLNPVNPALLARAQNRVIPKFKQPLNEGDIIKRNWLLVNINPLRPEGVSANHEEHETAITTAQEIIADLQGIGFPEPVLVDSGNGANLLYYIELPNDEASTCLLKNILIVLDERYSNDQVKIDTTTYKAAQLCRLYGTIAITGDETEDRPHRVSQILHCPTELEGVPFEILEQLGNQVKTEIAPKPKAEENQSEILLRLVSGTEFFTNESNEAYAAVQVNGHMETFKLQSQSFNLWLTKQYYIEKKTAPGAEGMKQALTIMEMMARIDGEQKNLSLRVSQLEGNIYYDLGNKEWQAVKITPQGCELVEQPPILFYRNNNNKAQVTPIFDGDIKSLLKHVRVKDRKDEILYLVYMVTCFLPEIAHPVMVFCGEKGAAKTTGMRMNRAIVDPAIHDLLTMPNTISNLAIVFAKNYMPCFDNMDGLSSEKSDLLCTASTGGAISKRMLFTDDEEVILSFKRCIGLNGINVVVTKPDLLDRSIILELERISEEERKEERIVWEEFEADKPYIVGGALNILSQAMKIYPTVQLKRLGRMADFTRWGYAIAEAMGYGGDAFIEAYFNNQERANEEVISTHPLAAAIVALMESNDNWQGSVTELLEELNLVAEREKINTHVKAWPPVPHVLSRRLNEIKSNLKQVGINVDIRHAGKSKNAHITKVQKGQK